MLRSSLRLLSPLAPRVASTFARPALPGPAGWPSWCRHIITVNVYAPSPHSHPSDYRNEVRRNEDIAASKFNKQVRAEVDRGTAQLAGLNVDTVPPVSVSRASGV